MKRILMVCMVALITCSAAKAQNPQAWANPTGSFSFGTFPVYNTKLDTVTNTGTDTFKIALKNGYYVSYALYNLNSITFQLNFTKTSGTLGGTATYYGSVDGVNYVAIGTAYTVTNVASQFTSLIVNSPSGGNPFTTYMIVWAGTGTMVGSWQSFVLLR